ncbi:MAG: hypothetical protein AAF614_00220 [Chloroflexota bacterium]
MAYRIDGVVTPPGLISSAKTYSLILKDEGLYLIHTGPANGRSPNGKLRVNGIATAAAAKATAKIVDKRIAKKVAAGEAQLNEKGPEALLQQKHSKLLAAEHISAVKVDEGRSTITLNIRSSQGKFKFWFPLEGKTAVETIQKGLAQ